MRPLHYAILFFLSFALVGSAQAQTAPAPVKPTVAKIEIQSGKHNNVNDTFVRAHLEVREGSDYDQVLVDRSVRSLYDTGLFEFVQAELVELSPSTIKLVFHLQTKPRIQTFALNGNIKYSHHKVMKKAGVNLNPGNVLDEMSVRKGCDGIRDFYRSKGYYHVKVDYTINRNDKTELGDVAINITEGERMHIKRILFEGNEKFTAKELRGEMETSRWKWWWSWLSGSGRLDDDKLDDDLIKLRSYYANAGYLDAEINDNSIRYEQKSGGAVVIIIKVKEGREYFVGDINIEGEDVLDELTLTRSLDLVPGDPFSPKKLDEDTKKLEDIYGSIGRLEARVKALRRPNMETGNIDITYQITEGDEYKIQSILIAGNNKTMSTVILRELAMRPGQVFNTMWMKSSEARLKNTRFFDEVTVNPESTNIPGRKNLKVTVHEAPTAQFQFGVGFSTTEQGTVFAQYTQGNFDLFNARSFFQGAGQKFQVSVSLGSSSNDTEISFEEPYFMQQHLGLGVDIFRTETSYESDYYDTTRFGLDVYMRKRLWELWEGRLTYTIENVKVSLVNSDVTSDIFAAEAGSKMVSKVGFLLSRDTRDDMLFTNTGSRVSINTEVAGLGGDAQYVKIDARTALFMPTFDVLKQNCSILARAGTAWPLDGGIKVDGVNYGLPIFDRFFLGGPQSLRGFDYHAVGPRDGETTDPIGGNSYGFTSVEYTFKIAEQFRIAIFYDWGFVNIASCDFNPVNFNDDIGIGLRMLVMNNPLSLDYGIPLTSDEYNNKGGQFNFSFGTRF